jgi:hypothetical protein
LLKNRDTKTYFGEPVHRTMYPDYYNTIKEPRDLGTIKSDLSARKYADPAAFRDDVRLCFQNCRAYNPAGHFIRNYGDAASEKFEQIWARSGVEAAWAAAQAGSSTAGARREAGPSPWSAEQCQRVRHVLASMMLATPLGRMWDMVTGLRKPRALLVSCAGERGVK